MQENRGEGGSAQFNKEIEGEVKVGKDGRGLAVMRPQNKQSDAIFKTHDQAIAS